MRGARGRVVLRRGWAARRGTTVVEWLIVAALVALIAVPTVIILLNVVVAKMQSFASSL